MKIGWRRFALTFLIYFACLMGIGVVWMCALSVSETFWTGSERHFLLSWDEVGFLAIISFLMCFLPAFIAALFAAIAAYFCRRLIWWHALISMPLAVIVAGLLAKWPTLDHFGMVTKRALVDPVTFLAVSGLMIVGAQAAWLFARSMYASDCRLVKK